MERGWDFDGTVGLLMCFEERDEKSRERGTTAVQDVRKAVFACGAFETGVHAAGLEIFAVGAARNFQVLILARSPDLDVIGFGAGETHVACAEENDVVMEAELLEDSFGIYHHFFEFLVAVLRFDQLDEFDFVELVNANHAACADSGGASFSAEARAISAIINRELIFLENFLAMNVRNGRLGGGKEIEIALGAGVEAFLDRVGLVHELWELSNANHAMATDDVRRRDFGIAVMGGVQIQ